MIRLLLFAVVISPSVRATAGPEPCPEDAACLFHFKCIGHPNPGLAEVTDDGTSFTVWKTKKCENDYDAVTELKIRPATNHKWRISLTYQKPDVKIQFGSPENPLLSIEVDKENKHPEYIEPIDGNSTFSFTVDEPDVNLYERFKDSEILFIDGSDTVTTPPQPASAFRKRILELTKCDASLIVDTKVENSALVRNEAKVTCSSGKLWLKSASDWKLLNSLVCGHKKEWAAADEKDLAVVTDGKFNVQCSPEKPATTTSSTSTTTSTTTTTTETPTTAANTTTTTESPESTSKPASSILPSAIIPILISGLLLV